MFSTENICAYHQSPWLSITMLKHHSTFSRNWGNRGETISVHIGEKISILKTSTVYHYMGLLVSGIILKIR